jgi:hypothetical protein
VAADSERGREAAYVRGWTAEVVSNNSKMAGLSEAWPGTRQDRTLEDRDASDNRNRRLPALPAFLLWTVFSVSIWGGIIWAVALIR